MNNYNYLNNRIIYYFLFLVIATAALFSSCHSQRKAAKTSLKEYGDEKMAENQFHFETLSMKAAIAVSSNTSKGDNLNLTGTIRIIRDSVIWVSVSPGLGIEAARLYVTQDSVFFLNRINSEYAATSFGFFNTQFQVDLDFNTLQALFTGNESSNIKTLENQQRKLQVAYSNFVKIEDQLFPQRAVFEVFIQESGKNINSIVSINFSKIELNKEVSIPFSIPEKYKRIEL